MQINYKIEVQKLIILLHDLTSFDDIVIAKLWAFMLRFNDQTAATILMEHTLLTDFG